MFIIKNTPNNTGVSVYGDHMDFENLYEALHNVTGDEYEFPSYSSARIRVLGVCYDLRHAMMGGREVEFVDNGMDAEKKRRLGIVAPDKNLYLKINVLWPEMLFVTMALNDFINLYARKKAKLKFEFVLDRCNIWDPYIAIVRLFQSEIAKCVKETVSEASFVRMMNIMNKDYPWMDGYITQYLDLLNLKFINMNSEKRLKSIPTMAKRLAEKGDEYQRVKEEVIVAAKEYGSSVEDIRLREEYPEEIVW